MEKMTHMKIVPERLDEILEQVDKQHMLLHAKGIAHNIVDVIIFLKTIDCSLDEKLICSYIIGRIHQLKDEYIEPY